MNQQRELLEQGAIISVTEGQIRVRVLQQTEGLRLYCPRLAQREAAAQQIAGADQAIESLIEVVFAFAAFWFKIGHTAKAAWRLKL